MIDRYVNIDIKQMFWAYRISFTILTAYILICMHCFKVQVISFLHNVPSKTTIINGLINKNPHVTKTVFSHTSNKFRICFQSGGNIVFLFNYEENRRKEEKEHRFLKDFILCWLYFNNVSKTVTLCHATEKSKFYTAPTITQKKSN